MVVPPQRGIEGDVEVEQFRVDQEGLGGEQPGQGFPDQALLARGAVAPPDLREQFIAEEGAEVLRTTARGRQLQVAFHSRGTGEVALAVRVGDAHQHDRADALGLDQLRQRVGDVRKILAHDASIGHVQHGQLQAFRGIGRRHPHVDGARLIQPLRLDGEAVVLRHGVVVGWAAAGDQPRDQEQEESGAEHGFGNHVPMVLPGGGESIGKEVYAHVQSIPVLSNCSARQKFIKDS